MRNSFTKILIVLVIALAVFFFMGYKAIYMPFNSNESDIKVTINIKAGSSINQIGEKLERSGLISNAKWFRLYTYIYGFDTKMKSGIYKLNKGLKMTEVVEYIINNQNQEVFHHPNKISIPEGLTSEQIINLFVDANIGNHDELDQIFNDPKFIENNTGIKASSLEGFIYPKTYYYENNISAEDFLIKYPLAQFKKEFGDAINSDDFYTKLILASIVEKEAANEEEKPLIASVFLNRINRGMRLDSSATHVKIFAKRGVKPPSKLWNKHLAINSPYNTYKNPGLPPTPICSPAYSSYDAIINAPASEYLYFFASVDGSSTFSTSLSTHNNLRKKYQRR